jgi:hypothetical protein
MPSLSTALFGGAIAVARAEATLLIRGILIFFYPPDKSISLEVNQKKVLQ